MYASQNFRLYRLGVMDLSQVGMRACVSADLNAECGKLAQLIDCVRRQWLARSHVVRKASPTTHKICGDKVGRS